MNGPQNTKPSIGVDPRNDRDDGGITRTQASQSAMCGGQATVIPFDDVMPANIFFCSIAQAYFSGLSNGTDTTHYSPSSNVPREQMAAFVTRTMDQSLKRQSQSLPSIL